MSTGLHAGRQVALSFLILRLVVQPAVLVKGFFPNALFTVSVSFTAVHDIFESLFILSPCTLILPIKKNPKPVISARVFSEVHGLSSFWGKEIRVSYGLRCKGGMAD